MWFSKLKLQLNTPDTLIVRNWRLKEFKKLEDKSIPGTF